MAMLPLHIHTTIKPQFHSASTAGELRRFNMELTNDDTRLFQILEFRATRLASFDAFSGYVQ